MPRRDLKKSLKLPDTKIFRLKYNSRQSCSRAWVKEDILRISKPKSTGKFISLKLMASKDILQEGIGLKIKPEIGLCLSLVEGQYDYLLGGLSEKESSPIEKYQKRLNINYSKNNWCGKCGISISKIYIRCPDCGSAPRRRPIITREKQTQRWARRKLLNATTSL